MIRFWVQTENKYENGTQPKPPIITIDDDEIVVLPIQETSKPQVSLNTTIVSNRKAVKWRYDSKIDWYNEYRVTVDPTTSLIFERITNYKRKYANEFNEFNQQIWDHLMNNLQVRTFTIL